MMKKVFACFAIFLLTVASVFAAGKTLDRETITKDLEGVSTTVQGKPWTFCNWSPEYVKVTDIESVTTNDDGTITVKVKLKAHLC
jgi:hypothetical protein